MRSARCCSIWRFAWLVRCRDTTRKHMQRHVQRASSPARQSLNLWCWSQNGYTLTGAPRQCQASNLLGVAQTCAPNACPAISAAPSGGSLGTCAQSVPSGGSCTFACNQVC